MSFSRACAPLLWLVCSVSLWGMTSCGPPPKKLSGSAGGGADDPSWSPLTVAHCRATCLKELSEDFLRDDLCMQYPDCYACWKNCEMLHANWSNWSSVCSEKTSCLSGCRAACRFFEEFRGSQRQLQPVRETSAADLLLVMGLELRWPPAAPRPAAGAAAGAGAGTVVYVVMWRPNDSARWTQVTQTLECRAQLPASPEGPPPADTARVLVVDPGGLRIMYTPAGARQAAAAAAAAAVVARAMADLTNPMPGLVVRPHSVMGGVWSVRVQSLIHQGVLVIAELSWRDPEWQRLQQRQGQGHQYLVTWEVDGGGITGNLYTDSTCVTLSLWPDTVFHIQVELMSRSESVSRSRPLVVDTGRMALEGLAGDGGGSLVGMATYALSVALKLVMLVAALVLCYRALFLRRPPQQPEKAPLIVDFDLEDEPCSKDCPLHPMWTGSEMQAPPLEEKCHNINV